MEIIKKLYKNRTVIRYFLVEIFQHPGIINIRIKQIYSILKRGGFKSLNETLFTISNNMKFLQPDEISPNVATPQSNLDPDWSQYEILTGKINKNYWDKWEFQNMPAPALIQVKDKELNDQAGKLSFPVTDKPEVSIIIPVFNQIKLVVESLLSIVQNTETIEYEVIIVDDASIEESANILLDIKNLVYIKNDINLGFIETCNRGARIARGNYVVFLNNDVQVCKDWLRHLLETIKSDDTVGVVGPKIIFPEGRLQEAGALLRADGRVRMIGLYSNPKQERFNYVREVEYCSGVCMLLKRQYFLDIGGFNTDYRPAYCEDVDLCFRIRKDGYRIIYNPSSVIVHHLSSTTNLMDDNYKHKYAIRNTQRFVENWQKELDDLKKIKMIAFYLPQYHVIPENEEWWGKGFTDWKNVMKAMPNYEGHYQPHVPADFGYYDLCNEDIMIKQSALARRYGINGFCYYYYWFAGKKLLDLPLERMLSTGKPDMPFCLCWANENWTRTWDGKSDHILIGQNHSDEDDRAVILDIIRYMKRLNYIRINGKPLLLVYRINLFPDILRTQQIWRDMCRKEGIGEIYLAFVESFEFARENVSPSKYGFNASVEFPPHQMANEIRLPAKKLNPQYSGVVSDYRELVLRYLHKDIPGYTRFRTVMAGWDSTPRHPDNAYIFEYSTPGAYQAWLEAILKQTYEQNFGDERIVFVNAWNEWAEGAHLEPDQRFGHGFLEATKNALEKAMM